MQHLYLVPSCEVPLRFRKVHQALSHMSSLGKVLRVASN